MTNLLKETQEVMSDNNKTSRDIIFIGSERSGYSCSWEEYIVLANIEYDSGYGGAEIASDLILVFNDGSRLYRGEYDGSEWWDFMAIFKAPEEKHTIKRVKRTSYEYDLAEMNKDEQTTY
jgi:hypothetical protein